MQTFRRYLVSVDGSGKEVSEESHCTLDLEVSLLIDIVFVGVGTAAGERENDMAVRKRLKERTVSVPIN